MKIGQAIKMAVRSIGAKTGRTALTMLGIIIGVAAVVIMVSVVQGANRKTMEYYEKLGSNKINVNVYTDSQNDIGPLLYDFCARKQAYIIGVTPDGYISAPIRSGVKDTDSMDYTPNISLGNDHFAACNNFQIAQGRDISWLDIEQSHQVIVLGARLAEYLYSYTDPVGETVTIAGYPFTVIGVYAAKDPDSEYSMDNMAVVPESANRILNGNQPITSFVVKARDAAATKQAITELSAFLNSAAGQDNYSLYSEDQFAESSSKQNAMMSMVLGGIAGISLLVGGIGIMNIMLVTVSERTWEIGIRKSIGAPRSSILTQFLVESSLVCGTGGVMGILLGVLGSLLAGKLLLDRIVFPEPSLVMGAFGFSVFLGMGFGMYPAVKASGLTPVEALRAD